MKKISLLACLLMTGSIIGFVGCSKPTESESMATGQATTTANTETSVVSVQISSLLPMQAYDCLPAQKITATYDSQNPVEPQAMLEINGFIHVLYAKSTTDSIYYTDGGMADGEGMVWQVQADGATLSSVPLTENSNTPEKILYRCTHLQT